MEPGGYQMPAEQFAGNGCRFYFGDASKRSAILALLVATVLCFSLSLSFSLQFSSLEILLDMVFLLHLLLQMCMR
jgi:hypothetical protein